MIGKIADVRYSDTTERPPLRAHVSSELLRRWMPSGDETAMKTAMYNTLFFVIALMGFAGLFAVYHLLYMFLKPMLWAALVGTVLFPFKRKVTSVMRDWLASLRETHTPLVVGTLMLPWNWLNNIAEQSWQLMASRTGGYILLAYLTLKILTYERAFMSIFDLIARAYEIVDALIAVFTKKWILPLVLLYFCAYVAWVYVQPEGQVNKKFARMLSVPMWFYALAFTAQYFGPLRVFVFVVSALSIALIAAGVIGGEDEEDEKATIDRGVAELVKEVDEEVTRKLSCEPPVSEVIEQTLQLDEALTGDSYLRILFGLCFLLWTVRHGWMLFLLFLPLTFAAIKRAGEMLGVFAALQSGIGSTWGSVYGKLKKLLDVTIAGSIRKFIRLLFTSDRLFVGALEQSMDVVSSVVVMLALALGSLLMVIFVVMQLHGETVHLIKLGSSVISSHPEWLASAVNYTEGQLAEHDIDNYVEQAYTQGRAWLATKVRSLADASDTERADLLENQVKLMVDNIYNMWEQRTVLIQNDSSKRGSTNVDFFHHIKQATDLAALKEELTLIVKENMDTLMTIAQSVWGVLASNMSFLTSILVALLALVLNFGMELINSLIEIVVFMTMVYFLLANSKQRWLPLEWMSSLTPELVGRGTHVTATDSDSPTITGAIE
uniref:Transmembrane protein n=1 Tax=Plectus sambesii TaxID=2011161 RepID=A0A914X557_9BILA